MKIAILSNLHDEKTYKVEETVAKIRSLPVSERVPEDLASVLTKGLVR